MAKLRDFAVIGADGGFVTDRSDYDMERNMFKRLWNWDIDERGRLKTRLGYHIWGFATTNETFAGSYLFPAYTAGSTPTTYHIAVTRDATADIYKVVGSYLSSAITTSTTTITVNNGTDFAASGTIEIEGDLIAYTGKSSNDLTGVTGIRVAHPANAPVNQLISIATNAAVDTRSGVYFSVLNNTLFINGRAGSVTLASDGSTVAAVSDADEPGGLFATNYRERIYVAGSGVADGSGTRNGSEIRVSFSDAGDSTSWDINNFFDLEDDHGERITGMIEGKDVLVIFKTNSTFVYDEVQQIQTQRNVGAYNQNVIQKLGDSIFTFCPRGVFITNGHSSKLISKPIEKYLKRFLPRYDGTVSRVVTNCSAGVLDNKYYLYLDHLEEPEDIDHVMFVYDSIRNNWTGYRLTMPESTNFIWSIASLAGYNTGTPGGRHQPEPSLFLCLADTLGNPANGSIHKMFGVRYFQAAGTNIAFDFFADAVVDSAGSPISAEAETRWYDFNSPMVEKFLPVLVGLVEQGDAQISYRLELTSGKITDWKSLGLFRGIHGEKLPLNENHGLRIALRITAANDTFQTIFNGFIFQNPQTIEEQSKYARFSE